MSALIRMTLEAMLRWAYGLQMVDVMTGKTVHAHDDREMVEFHETSLDGIASLAGEARRIKLAGAGRARWHPGLDVHPDAELLHDEVLALGPIDADLVIRFGYTGTHPEPVTAQPRPAPALPSVEVIEGGKRFMGDRQGRCTFDGEIVLYRIAVSEVVYESRDVYRAGGKRGFKFSHTEIIRTEVEYCPVFWWPDPVWVQAVNGIHQRWIEIMNRLRVAVSRVTFKNHILTHREIAPIDLSPAKQTAPQGEPFEGAFSYPNGSERCPSAA